jgi:hypothetical protein
MIKFKMSETKTISNIKYQISNQSVNRRTNDSMSNFQILILVIVLIFGIWNLKLPTVNASLLTNYSSSLGLTSGLTGWWTMDNQDISGINVSDKSGSGNTGTISGPIKTIGKIGQAMKFNGTSDIFDVGNLAENSAGTVSLWIKPDVNINSTNYSYGLLTNDDPASVQTILLRWYESSGNGALNFWMRNGGNWVDTATTTTSWKAGTWYHIVASWGNGATSVYVDGNFQNGGSQSAPSTQTGTWRFGESAWGTTAYYFKGAIDDIRFFNRALSVSEIKRLYNMGAGLKIGSVLK